MLMTIPWAPWLQFRLCSTGAEILSERHGVVKYGVFWKRSFKIIWGYDVLFDSCGHRKYWCGCWSAASHNG